jgi:hypothetical protein
MVSVFRKARARAHSYLAARDQLVYTVPKVDGGECVIVHMRASKMPLPAVEQAAAIIGVDAADLGMKVFAPRRLAN